MNADTRLTDNELRWVSRLVARGRHIAFDSNHRDGNRST